MDKGLGSAGDEQIDDTTTAAATHQEYRPSHPGSTTSIGVRITGMEISFLGPSAGGLFTTVLRRARILF